MKRNCWLACALLLICALGFARVPASVWADEWVAEEEQMIEDAQGGSAPGPLGTGSGTSTPVVDVAPEQEDEGEMEAEDVPADDPQSKQAGGDAGPVASAMSYDPAVVAVPEEDVVRAENEPTAQPANVGTGATISAEATTEYLVSRYLTDNEITKPTVAYRGHMQSYGWSDYAINGQKVGMGGYRLEGIEMGVKVPGYTGGIRYQVCMEGIGWRQGWRANGKLAGTEGKSKSIEALRIELTGDVAKKYNVWYRSYVRSRGWGGWTLNGKVSGLEGKGKRIESIQVKLFAKGSSTVRRLEGNRINYNVRMQTYGWMATVGQGAKAGAAPDGKRMEAINICLGKTMAGSIRYRSYIEGNGWEQDFRSDGETSGTIGEGKAIRAIRIALTGKAKAEFDIWYRVYAHGSGWHVWTENGMTARATGKGEYVESIQITLVRKGKPGPENPPTPVPPAPTPIPLGGTLSFPKSLIYLDAGHGPSGASGYDTGAKGSGYYEADETAELVTLAAEYAKSIYNLNVYNNVGCNVHYTSRQAHAASVGATSFVSIHFNWATTAATGTESYIYRTYPGYTGFAAKGSSAMQRIMHRHVVGALGLLDRGQKSEAFAVLNGSKTGIPATLVEICFINNAGDMKRYKAREDKVAREIAAGLYEIAKAGY